MCRRNLTPPRCPPGSTGNHRGPEVERNWQTGCWGLGRKRCKEAGPRWSGAGWGEDPADPRHPARRRWRPELLSACWLCLKERRGQERDLSLGVFLLQNTAQQKTLARLCLDAVLSPASLHYNVFLLIHIFSHVYTAKASKHHCKVLCMTLQWARLTFNRLLFDAVAWRHRRGRRCCRRAEGLRELFFRGDGTFDRASIFEALLRTQVDFDGAILAL